MKGKIKKYLSYRGYGFIEVEGKEGDIFFHVSNYPQTSLPQTGQEIEFTLTETPKGEEATEIKIFEKTDEILNEETEKITEPEQVDQPEPQEETEEADDLDKLPGIGPKYQELLRAAGINSTNKLSKEDPEELYSKLNKANDEKEITKRPPNLDNVKAWINLAR